jgi:membrane fusion protein, multidrug efflux system
VSGAMSTSSPAPLAPPQPASPGLRAALARAAIPVLILAVVGAFVALAILQWDRWLGAATVQVTDNATVRTEMTRLSSRVSGAVERVAVQDFQAVRAGDLLVQVDARDYQAAVAQAEASVAGARAALDNLANQLALQQATIEQADAQRAAAEAHRLNARQELERQQALLQSTFGTRQKLQAAVADEAAAASAVQAAAATAQAQRRQADVLGGTRQQRAAELQAAEANLEAARLRLGYTRIVAPFDGVVSERQVQPGDYVTAGSSLIAVLPLPDVYVVANYKETQLTRVAVGQPVSVTVDTFPGQVLSGRVQRLSPGTGAQFALLPPDNATGNFTKVVQRIPVRIALDPGQPLLPRLRPGMSVTARIDTSGDAPAPRP